MAGSIRENILFGQNYDHDWYGEVISCCGLLPDLAQLDQGDNTSVGQEGIALSGGQRARIGLARAIYRSRLYKGMRFFVFDKIYAISTKIYEHKNNILIKIIFVLK